MMKKMIAMLLRTLMLLSLTACGSSGGEKDRLAQIKEAGKITMATACLGNVGHSWQNTAFACSDIGMKGTLRAAEVMTLAAIRTMEQPELVAKAKEELAKKNGGKYLCPLPDYVVPPIGKY